MVANPHREQLARIFSVARAEYGRIDYAVRDGRVQTWEINLHPTIGRGPGESHTLVPPELLPFREETKAIFYRVFQEAWTSVDLPATGRPPAPVVIGHRGASVRDSRIQSPSRATRLLRRSLGPLLRLGERIAAPILPVVARLAVRRARSDDRSASA